ncbi:conjugal transfer protein [Paenibacillus sp. UMB7766-LJ446]|uniref:conjugal transfer protein n=1 Tax=Paenibacillus sp. UMB7766-LJ446 TaxID=3046313 RepID=UPI00255014A7|nr:conjugal transfer protein [Paenibacillus sp. UMB7766-LJ446]MDK8193245.1 conjugal transfer protein [Paenibacillus sp. UMB7766-LJ446]
MGFLSKKPSKLDGEQGNEESIKKQRKFEKGLKPKSPKRIAGKRFVRYLFWTFLLFLIIKGAVSYAKGTQIIQEVTNIGTNQTIVEDSLKGFASDFATEYFTWTVNNVNDRAERLQRFISGIDQDAGLKGYDIKGSSNVLSVEIYDTAQISDTQYEVTLNVRREVDMDSLQEAQSPKDKKGSVIKKTYMVVPVTVSPSGYVIQSHPRFIGNQLKGASDSITPGELNTNVDLINQSTELATNVLQAYFAGNVNQLKYFYEDSANAPASLSQSDFTLNKIENVSLYNMPSSDVSPEHIRMETSVLVQNDIGEVFTNRWILNVLNKGDRLYVLSIGEPKQESLESTEVIDINPQQQTNDEKSSEEISTSEENDSSTTSTE